LLVASAWAWWLVQPGAPGFGLFGLAIVWPALLVRAGLRARGGWTLTLITWLAYLGPWAVCLEWVRHVSVAGYPALIAYSALWPAVFITLVRWIKAGTRRVPWSVLAGVVWVALEYLRAEVVFDAWPFHLAGHSQWGGPQAMRASIGGVWLVGLLVVSAGAAVGALVARRGVTTWDRVWETAMPLVLIVVGGVLAAPKPQEGPHLRLLGVQTNLPQDNKIGWSIERQAQDVPGFLTLTEAGIAEHEPDLVVWPETMVPGLGFEPTTLALLGDIGPSADPWLRWPREILAAATRSGIPWIVGTPTWMDVVIEDGMLESGGRYNSAVLVEPGGVTSRVDKVFLTPFGETMPYVRAWPWLESLVMDLGASGMRFDLDTGTGPSRLVLELGEGGDWWIAVPICFEDAVPSVTRSMCVWDGHVEVDAIINISNDGWFGASDAGRVAHATAAAWRAVELGRPLMRVANTGLSGVYLPNGTTQDVTPARMATTLLATLPRYEGQTLQAWWGNWLPRVCLLAVVVGCVRRWRSGGA